MPVSSVPIPPLFLERMQRYLGDEFAAFAESLNAAPQSGLRVNTLKITPEDFLKLSPAELGAGVPWCGSAFTVPPSSFSFGQHPYHVAGLYYLQDPSAMAPAQLLDPHPGERVLDLAAAPGGKTTQLAALMQGRGLLVANEIKNKRVGHLAQNVERWGAPNVVITNESPERLADHFGTYFDRVLVDAPCSGEGMFRKDMGARADWSPEMVEGCAARQSAILRVAAKLVRPGGYLLYSTCTFAPEEDEGVIHGLISGQTEIGGFEAVALPQYDGFLPGQPEWLDGEMQDERGLRGAVRLFPHRIAGEGHFVCLLKRRGGADYESALWRAHVDDDQWARLQKSQLGFWRAFAAETLNVDLLEDRLRVVGERLYYIPEVSADFGRLRVIHPGVWLGSFKKERFEPAHPLALMLTRGAAQKTFDLAAADPRLASYLRGETIETRASGWTVVSVDGFPLGWGKGVQGVLKNHFPRGWLMNS